MGLTLLAHAHIPLSFWVSAFQTVVYLINLLPSVVLHSHCPFELLYHKQSNYLALQPFGCTYFPYLRPYNRHKFDILLSVFLLDIVMIMRVINVYIHRAEFIFPDMFTLTLMSFPISPCFSHLGSLHLCLILLDRLQQFFILFHPFLPVFLEYLSQLFLLYQILILLHQQTTLLSFSSSSSSSGHSSVQPSQPPRIPKYRLPFAPSIHPMLTRSQARPSLISSPHVLFTSVEPSTVHEALLDSHWTKAMQEEFTALQSNHIWDLVPFSFDMNLIGCKWVFCVKYKSDGSILRHKAWLVTKGFLQTSGIDYGEIFSPVVKAPTIRVLFSLAISFGWDIQQVDINNTLIMHF